ncbi:hypothetical protein T12_9720 [Trichinella patagoniensis]|uniref:Uncharacterized protein n=1 Tax=Trichinella patagoniensis TaxID=990121 RepID=A0A0V0YVJ6_9BILA|nr:hypothetical protein T12_9720 [Trichinella patagoniensis]
MASLEGIGHTNYVTLKVFRNPKSSVEEPHF